MCFLCRLELNICWNLIKNKQYTYWERCLFEAVKQANLGCDDLESSNWFPTNFLHWCFGELLSGYSSCWPFAFVCLRCFLCVFLTFYHSKSTGNHHYFSNHPTSKSKFVLCVENTKIQKLKCSWRRIFFWKADASKGHDQKSEWAGDTKEAGLWGKSVYVWFCLIDWLSRSTEQWIKP